MKPFPKKEKSEWVYQGHIVSLKLESYHFGKKTKTIEVIHHQGAVVIVPIQQDGTILLIQQFRPAVDGLVIELPAGTLEKNESPIECAKRELQEEIGFGSKKIRPLGGFYSAPGYCDEFLHLFVAEELYPSKLEMDEDEMIDLFPVNLQEAQKLIKENRIQDAKTIAGILYYLMVYPHA